MHDNFNVIVFSSQGEFPTCKKMSNGDLDGDVYFACWDPDIIKYFNQDVNQNDEIINEEFGASEINDEIIERPLSDNIADHIVWFY